MPEHAPASRYIRTLAWFMQHKHIHGTLWRDLTWPQWYLLHMLASEGEHLALPHLRARGVPEKEIPNMLRTLHAWSTQREPFVRILPGLRDHPELMSYTLTPRGRRYAVRKHIPPTLT